MDFYDMNKYKLKNWILSHGEIGQQKRQSRHIDISCGRPIVGYSTLFWSLDVVDCPSCHEWLGTHGSRCSLRFDVPLYWVSLMASDGDAPEGQDSGW